MTGISRRLAILLALALGGCVMFEQPPASLRCDSELVGRWIPLADDSPGKAPTGPGDYLLVDARCHASNHETGKPDPREFRALGFMLGQQRYLAFDFKDLTSLLSAATDNPASLPKGLPARAVALAHYRIRDDVLEVAMLDYNRAIEQIRAGKLKAREIDASNFIFSGRQARLRALLREHPDLFQSLDAKDGPMRLRRAKPGDLP